MVICLQSGANDLQMVQLMPPIISCCIKIQTGLTFLVLVYPVCPGKEAVKLLTGCVLSAYLPLSTRVKEKH